MSDKISISLPSLIHRSGRAAVKQAQLFAKQHDCELKRVRRSRNWCLIGEAIAIQAYCHQLVTEQLTGVSVTTAASPLSPPSDLPPTQYRFLIQKLEAALLLHADKLESLESQLARLIAADPNVTLGELMQLTQCTIAKARLARFNAEI